IKMCLKGIATKTSQNIDDFLATITKTTEKLNFHKNNEFYSNSHSKESVADFKNISSQSESKINIYNNCSFIVNKQDFNAPTYGVAANVKGNQDINLQAN
nr:hypothetical protein [Pleurocapsa sp. MO_192.B19]